MPRRAATLMRQSVRKRNGKAQSVDTPTLRLIQELRGIARKIPRAELDKLPADLIENLDHYIYGTPKR